MSSPTVTEHPTAQDTPPGEIVHVYEWDVDENGLPTTPPAGTASLCGASVVGLKGATGSLEPGDSICAVCNALAPDVAPSDAR